MIFRTIHLAVEAAEASFKSRLERSLLAAGLLFRNVNQVRIGRFRV